MLALGFVSGQMPNRGSGIDRHDDLAWFWAFAALWGAGGLLLLGMFIWTLIDPTA